MKNSFTGNGMKRVVLAVSVALAVAWCAVVLLSWLLSAMMVPGVRSLLTGEGIRWLFAHFTDGLSTPQLVWLLLASMAAGCASASGLLRGGDVARHGKALRAALLLLAPYLTAMTLLTMLPHAVLLSATGTLAGSPFCRALVPVLCFGTMLFSVAYGVASHRLSSLADIVGAMVGGLRAAAPLLFVYVLAAQLLQTLLYVFV